MTTKEQLLALSKFGTATIHEALGKTGALPYEIKGLNPSMRICGPAYPIECAAYSNVNLHRAYAYAPRGSVLVAECSGAYDAGYWGDLLTTGAMKQGMAGLVINACVRDADEIENLGFPVFCRGLCIKGTGKDPRGVLNEAIKIGDVIIEPGDIVVGDRDGIVIVPKGRVEEAIEFSKKREEKEANTRARILKGETSLQIYGWDKEFGY
ncbi:RraA family protein [Jiulongibacter sediminis]|uniref:Putative 4-hydroxy-4-methyl-2-oxoglutarate aldolase n=1 Tax=Jiulongibacter sediminis TaxID=1605367 RepID=A0A0P7C865_9BACT|nr:RraA family protein [Jiulongibacter sediminis]KPM49753.1 4-hydroxy-4-methyl-2-oxoglutarate aldolase [Jiulongibacter sediminis]TBX26789.1 4-hydroxy-4-methyl-2-oxoglutarate aldolase [Jiulongibacter sediminis]